MAQGVMRLTLISRGENQRIYEALIIATQILPVQSGDLERRSSRISKEKQRIEIHSITIKKTSQN